MGPCLRFSLDDIVGISNRYEYPNSETELMAQGPAVRDRGHLVKSELEALAHWKSPRAARHAGRNSEQYVAEVTRFALGTKCERARIESLTLLDGVSWPTASVILHLFHRDRYPIIDFRAIWSVSLDVPRQYSFDYWWAYVAFCRGRANAANVDMRTLDRALWQYSKENQKPGS